VHLLVISVFCLRIISFTEMTLVLRVQFVELHASNLPQTIFSCDKLKNRRIFGSAYIFAFGITNYAWNAHAHKNACFSKKS
jgi:hypothetical protein